MEWAGNSEEIIVQELNRNQNESDLLLCNAKSGEVKSVFKENDKAWIDIISSWDRDYQMGGWDWLKNARSIDSFVMGGSSRSPMRNSTFFKPLRCANSDA